MVTSEANCHEDDCECKSLDNFPTFSPEQVRKHDKAWDCWMIVHGRVYDIGPILSSHPGGSQILLKYAGMDATYQFDDVGHSMESLLYDMPQGSFKGYVVGTIKKGRNPTRDSKYAVTKAEKGDDAESLSGAGDYITQTDSIIMGRGQSLDGYLLWNKVYSLFLILTILFCLFALMYMKVYQHMTSTNNSTTSKRDNTFASFTSYQEQVSDTDGIPDWAY
ncbi:hypothetical protein HG535_0F03600 [Zygotorulaspora mrakii]|uniref:Cytochrome b5 heme-binding domain-containing protein n=1 Tax=Zygotorulaspora mrakii TaxID=42260 RepID=A0A7H9B7B3_ZYGMR|nr:uncharacterized protein HG535_0F03600 [Zygotorulaspora mrakii]QLG73849.1 hypothetical protein HG535_0F03600 [Zygotorulaspora mrakii]